MLNVKNAMKSDRLMKAIIGMTVGEFLALLPVFSKLLYETAVSKERVRQPGGGALHTLADAEDKLFYTLFYLKCYPTFDLAAFFYNVDRAQTCRWTHRFMPVLEKALGKELVLPARQIKSAEEFIRLFPEIKEVFIDGTERPVERSKNKEKQKQDYSGKKKRHTRKNIIVSDEKRRVLILTKTAPGSKHDYTEFKESEISEYLPVNTVVNVDLGFQGIKKDYPDLDIKIPHKKPRGRELTKEQKEENRKLSSRRVLAEHAIGGVKRLRALSNTYRNKKEKFLTVNNSVPYYVEI
jgi:hypothetical protein